MRMVLLRHDLPNGSSHYDWMIERDSGALGGQGGLLSYRVSVRIDLLAEGKFEAERIGDHRREYLDFEGEVSGGRGSVIRVASGHADTVRECGGTLEIVGVLGVRGVWRGVQAGEVWRFAVESQ